MFFNCDSPFGVYLREIFQKLDEATIETKYALVKFIIL